MEKVADRMQGIKLSVLERKEVKIGWTDGKKVGMVEHQAMAKLMAEKLAFAEAMETTLGMILCPMKGLEVKDLGENIFLFTFHQESGKKRALSEGPWSFAKSLLVFEDYDPDKTLSEYCFSSIPIWIHVFDLPLGGMNRDTGELIGEEVGEFMSADVGGNGMAIGKYLHIKITLAKGENVQYGNWLRAYIPRGGGDPNRGLWESGRAPRDGKMAFPMDAVHTEAEACIQGLTAAMKWGMTRVVVETDSKVLVDALNKEEYDRSHIGVIMRDAQMLAGLNFSNVSFRFCRRNYNKVAHAMAALGASGDAGSGLLWPDDVPNDVAGLVASDIVMRAV
ncbi:hypothetical protein D1007_17459 [Hordeum vulgare]|nr:hypothetical protein D1007_17459 [Hordeum vulgare]